MGNRDDVRCSEHPDFDPRKCDNAPFACKNCTALKWGAKEAGEIAGEKEMSDEYKGGIAQILGPMKPNEFGVVRYMLAFNRHEKWFVDSEHYIVYLVEQLTEGEMKVLYGQCEAINCSTVSLEPVLKNHVLSELGYNESALEVTFAVNDQHARLSIVNGMTRDELVGQVEAFLLQLKQVSKEVIPFDLLCKTEEVTDGD